MTLTSTAWQSADMRSIIWDIGGTMFDTYPLLDRALSQAVFGEATQEQLREVGALTRRSTGYAIGELARRHGTAVAALEAAEAAMKAQLAQDPAPLMEGAREVLHAVHAAGGLNLVATHRDRTSAEHLLRGWDVEVDDMVCAPDGFPRKPDPAMHRELLRRHRLDPAEVLAVGDRPGDVEAARAASVRGVLLSTPGGDHPHGDAEQIHSLRELLGFLGG